MSVRRRRRVSEEGHSGPDERWMASYLDMITVLMCLFIVLFAMSTVDAEKFKELANSLATGFGKETSETADVAQGVIVPPESADEDGTALAAESIVQQAQEEYDDLAALRDRLHQALALQGLEAAATFRIDELGLTVGLVSAETLFATNSTKLSDRALAVLSAIGGVLTQVPNQISVEGHADYRAPTGPFPTNWELSSGRATQVLRYLVEAQGMPPTNLRAVGFGDSRPVTNGVTDAELAADRRVDIVVLSAADEEVRQLLAEISLANAAG